VVSLHDRDGILARVEGDPGVVQPRFCPIADLKRGVVAGFEVVLAIGDGEPVSPRAWSHEMHLSTAGRLEARLMETAIRQREHLAANAFLAVNVSAGALRGDDLQRVLTDAGRLERLVLVVTDEADHEEAHVVRAALERVREAGGLVAVDETGSGYASLRQVLAIRPDFVRIGSEFVAEMDRDQAKAAVVETLGALASRIDAWVIAAGIPGRPELSALRRMGVPLGQGRMVGPPATEMGPLDAIVTEAIRLASPPAEASETVAALIEARPALPWGGSLEDIADAFLADPRHDVVVLVDERNRPLALAERAALLRGEPFERPVMRITPTSPLKAVARRAAARPLMERFHPLVACDRRGVYLGVVRVEQLLDALAQDD
jgi:EAL domain-containing protein (putative c-di-GMP-specific phosphodiesterase class I)